MFGTGNKKKIKDCLPRVHSKVGNIATKLDYPNRVFKTKVYTKDWPYLGESRNT